MDAGDFSAEVTGLCALHARRLQELFKLDREAAADSLASPPRSPSPLATSVNQREGVASAGQGE